MIATTAAFLAATLTLGVDGAAPPPVRHLVYAFTYSNSQTQTQHDSGISSNDRGSGSGLGGDSGGLSAAAPSSGVAESKTSVSDKGSILVDVVRVQPDSGLVVSISEKANDRRSALPATCVVYGNTNVICDPNKQINTEELALLRLLGENFIEPAQVDANNHWRVDQSGPQNSDVADFSIGKNDAGMMKITSTRVLKATGAQGFTSTSDGVYTYDYNRLLPTDVFEDETLRQNGGAGTYTTVRTQTTLALATDSAATKP
ncbi:MAG: hypothetical protein M3R30_04890 [Candidatus Eremiobacteraeota bacterium]|nr:hypothetical protein [Candidatus Eremiobacteraeota bacterium]